MTANDIAASFDLNTSIEILKNKQRELRKQRKLNQRIDINLLFEAAEISQNILKRLNDRVDVKRDEDLHRFIKSMFDITFPLLIIAKEDLEKTPSASTIFKKISVAFDQFKLGVERKLSKENLELLRGVIGFVPLLDNVIHCCETMPYYFHYANKKEKLALILSAILMVSALAFTIASFANPALAAVPMIFMIALSYIKLAKESYKLAVINPEKKYKNNKKLEQTIKNLDAQVKNIKTVFKNIYDKELSEDVIYKHKKVQNKKSEKD